MDKACTKCKVLLPFDSFSNDKHRKDGKAAWCRACIKISAQSRPVWTKRKEYNARYQAENKDTIQQRSKAYHQSTGYKAGENWRLANMDKAAANCAKYRAQKFQATPKWLTEEHYQRIEAFYTQAQEGGLVVDHVIPLRSKRVCGLHVPWNLQLLTKSENSKKGNRF